MLSLLRDATVKPFMIGITRIICGFGVVLSYIVVRIIETGASRYVRTPNLPACLYACGVGAVFALIVNLIALRKIKQLNLTNVSGN